MIPPDERFEYDNAAIAGIHLRLVMQDELRLINGSAKLLDAALPPLPIEQCIGLPSVKRRVTQ